MDEKNELSHPVVGEAGGRNLPSPVTPPGDEKCRFRKNALSTDRPRAKTRQIESQYSTRTQCHYELTVEPVHETAVSRYDAVEILDPVRPLDPAGQESAEGRNEAREEAQGQCVELYRHDAKRELPVVVLLIGGARDARP